MSRTWLERLGFARAPARIAPAQHAHGARLAAIHAGAFARPWGPEEFEAFLSDRTVRVEAAFLGRDPAPVGFVVSRLVLDEAEILSLALAPNVRGRGIATALLGRHLQTLAGAGAAKVHLEVEDGNAPALALYRRHDFEPAGRRPGYYQRPDGTRASALSMTLDLSEPAAIRA